MTVSMQLTKRIYTGNGLSREWDVDFPLSSAADLRIFLTSPLGKETEVQSDFEFDAVSSRLTYPTLASGKAPLEEGWLITLQRQTPLTQEIDLLRQGELDAEVLEQGYDKLTLLVQEMAEKIDRCIKYPVSTQTSNLQTEDFLNRILEAKQAATDAATQAVLSAQQAQASAQQSQQTAQAASGDIEQAKQSAEEDLTALAQTLQSTLNQTVTSASTYAQAAQTYAQQAHQDVSTMSQTLLSKADVDLANLSTEGKTWVTQAGLPSATCQDLTLGATGTRYTAPEDGWFAFDKISTAQTQTSTAKVYDAQGALLYRLNQGYHNAWILPVLKGYTLVLDYTLAGTTNFFKFIYAQGAV